MHALRSAVTAVVLLALACLSIPADAAITPEQRQELAAISRDVGEASRLLRKKDVDAAEKAIDDAEERLDALLAEGVPENERLVAIVRRNIELRRRAIALQRGERPAGVSFSDDVAPIIRERCLGCHGANQPRGGLRLDTFAGWKQGGASRQPLIRVLFPRLTANPPQRMPKGQEPLTAVELRTIGRWLQQGANFDGRGDNAPIGEKADEGDPAAMPEIAKPEGDETVSFVNDVAPFMVNICGQCHTGDNPRGGLNLTTFEGLMRGGDTGEVIAPGEPELSRLWLMVSNQEQPRMPPGQLRITRENYDALTTWIREGAKFDGNDPKTPLRELVPSVDEMRSQELATLSPEEFVAHRREASEAQWNKAFPKEQSQHLETDQFLVYGNVTPERLKQAVAWADEQAAALRSMFSTKGDPLWKGKLAIFLTKDRFGYEEFALAVNDRSRVPQEIHGHAVVTPSFDEAYIVMEDVGDELLSDNPGLRALLANFLTQAYLMRGRNQLPDWAVQGTGLHVAAKSSPGNPFFRRRESDAEEALKGLRRPEELFEDGTFSPAESGAVSYALVDFLVQTGGPGKFSTFLARLSESGDAAAAVQSVYRTTPAALAVLFQQHVARRR